MHVAAISGQECPSNHFRESATQAGFDLWFVDRQVVEMTSHIEALDALVIFTGAAADREQESAFAMAHANCIPAYCASCAGADLCGSTSRTYSN